VRTIVESHFAGTADIRNVETSESEPAASVVPLARSRGTARLGFKCRGDRTVFETLYQAGCLRIRMPRTESGFCSEAIVMNTSGGLTGGDEIALSARWRSGTTATLCNQAAEKIYRARDSVVRVTNRLEIDRHASAEWLPQETIIFDRAALDRRLDVHVVGESSFLGLESVVFGRTAMGEEVVVGRVRDAWRIYRDRRLIYADVLHLDGAIAERLDRAAIAAGARAVATILLVADGIARDLLERLRTALAGVRGRAAASLWNGVLAARFIAPDGESLRHDIQRALAILRGGRPLPRVWQC
jgi:urease accessory protein